MKKIIPRLVRYQKSIIVLLESVALCAAAWLSRLRTIPNGQSLHAAAAFALVIDLMGMVAAAGHRLDPSYRQQWVLGASLQCGPSCSGSASRGAARGHATKEVSQCPLP